MRRHILLLVFTAPVLLPLGATAQGSGFELTPFYGYQFGGSFDTDDREFGRLSFDVEESAALGATFGIPLGPHFQIELLYFQHDADLKLGDRIFAPGLPLGEVELEFYHAGMLWQSFAGQVRPYLALSGGITSLKPERGSSESEFSVSLGGGVKILFSDHLGVRFDGRMFVTDLGRNDPYYGGCCYYDDSTDLVQLQVAGGLILAF